jgi:polyphenol oxidase
MHPPHSRHSALDLPGMVHGFFGREGGVSEGVYQTLNAGPGSSDKADAVRENRERIARAMGLDGEGQLVSLYQVHGSDAVQVSAPLAERPRADGMVTDRPGLGLCILTADCGPVLFADAGTGVIGAAHAGWRGAVAGVLETTMLAMERIGAQISRTRAVLGPCIAQENYEVGHDFRIDLLRHSPWAEGMFRAGPTGKPHFDLKAYIEARLMAAGVAEVAVMAEDTYAEAGRYHSHRRNTHLGLSDYGRNAAVIALGTESE